MILLMICVALLFWWSYKEVEQLVLNVRCIVSGVALLRLKQITELLSNHFTVTTTTRDQGQTQIHTHTQYTHMLACYH